MVQVAIKCRSLNRHFIRKLLSVLFSLTLGLGFIHSYHKVLTGLFIFVMHFFNMIRSMVLFGEDKLEALSVALLTPQASACLKAICKTVSCADLSGSCPQLLFVRTG